jgi:hypothetical protein
MTRYFSSTIYVSRLSEFRGASFRLRRFSERRRMELRLQLADTLARLRELDVEIAGLGERSPDDPIAGLEAAKLNEEMERLIACEVEPTYVRAALESVQGLTIDGSIPDADLLFAEGPSALWAELTEAVRALAGLSEAEAKNFERLTTSNEGGGMPIPDINAVPASNRACTSAEIVPDTFLS